MLAYWFGDSTLQRYYDITKQQDFGRWYCHLLHDGIGVNHPHTSSKKLSLKFKDLNEVS